MSIFPRAQVSGLPLFPRGPMRVCPEKMFAGIQKAQPRLPVLSETTTTSLHLVSDDWTSGNWTDRSRFRNHAVVSGSPAKDTNSSLQKFGRKNVRTGQTATTAFRAPGEVSGPNLRRTYEMVMSQCGLTAGAAVIFGSDNIVNKFKFYVTTTAIGVGIRNAANTGFFLGTDTTGVVLAPATDQRPTFFTAVMDTGVNPYLALYVNGGLVYLTRSTTGTIGVSSVDLGVGMAWTGSAASFAGANSILEVLRHEEAFSPEFIASRAIKFNELRGF